jgi:hypothetical protein
MNRGKYLRSLRERPNIFLQGISPQPVNQFLSEVEEILIEHDLI